MKFLHFINDIFQMDDPSATPDEVLAEALNRPEKFTDDKRFDIELEGGDIHPTKNWIAWVDFRGRNVRNWFDWHYHLKIQVDDKQAFEWEVETYNPAFGAATLYLHWHDDYLIYIYAEKHSYYGVTATPKEIKHRVDLAAVGSGIHVDGNIVRVIPVERTYKGFIDQYRLPDWEKLDPLSEAKAREMGLLVDESDDDVTSAKD